jgi:hypothetical protein
MPGGRRVCTFQPLHKRSTIRVCSGSSGESRLKSEIPAGQLFDGTSDPLLSNQVIVIQGDCITEAGPWAEEFLWTALRLRPNIRSTKLEKARRPQMKQQNSKLMLSAPSMAATVMFLIQPLQAEVLERTTNVGDTAVHYKVVLPNDYNPAKAYPAILAFGGGPQTMSTVDTVLSRNFRAEAEQRGYIVIAPAAPDGQLFFEGEPASSLNF